MDTRKFNDQSLTVKEDFLPLELFAFHSSSPSSFPSHSPSISHSLSVSPSISPPLFPYTPDRPYMVDQYIVSQTGERIHKTFMKTL